MIAVDTNILVYAHREESSWHDAALAKITELAEGRSPWAIPWPCVHEFLAIVTHPRIYAPPTPLDAAIGQVEAWLESPSVVLLAETEGYWAELRSALEQGRINGPQVHDAVWRRFVGTTVSASYGQPIEISAVFQRQTSAILSWAKLIDPRKRKGSGQVPRGD